MRRKFHYVVFAGLLVSLLLGACADKKEATVQSVGTSRNSSTASQEASADESNSASVDYTTSGGKVIFVKGFNLYSWDLNSTEVLEAENIDPNQIYLSNDNQYVIYSTTREADRRQTLHIQMMHVASGTKTALTQIESRFARPAPNWWLINAEMEQGWILVGLWSGRQSSMLVKTDGTQAIDLGETNNLLPIWLADNTLLGIELNWNQQAQVNELARIWHFDPAVGVIQELEDLDASAYQDNWEGLVTELLQRGISFVEPPLNPNELVGVDGNVTAEPLDGNWSDICNVWVVNQHNGTSTTPIYENAEIARISGVSALTDGSYLIGERTYDDCDFDFPSAHLRRVVPGEDAVVLTDSLDPGDENFGFGLGWNASVSPDSRFVMWIGGGARIGETSLNLTDLMSNTTTILKQETFDLVSDGSVSEATRYKRVFWVAI